ncbi:hypothetical protein [Streptomyces sp. NPDC088847]|uniref:hypothetical protein n=1 Tax=Streptomyces sp. NPDC088847 TaxID=3365909 RepID=UPI00381CA47D
MNPQQARQGAKFSAGPGELLVQGEEFRVWIAGQRTGWGRLVPAQQYLLKTRGIEPAADGQGAVEAAPASRSQDARWAANVFLDNTGHRAAKLSGERRTAPAALGVEWALEGGAGCGEWRVAAFTSDRIAPFAP